MRWSNGTVMLLFAAMTFAACERNDRSAAHDETKSAQLQSAPAAPPSAALARRGMVGDVSGTLRGEASGLGTGGGAPEPDDANSTEPRTSPDTVAAMIIRTGTATIQVDSLEPAVARLRTLAQSLGGYVGNTSMQTGKDQLRSATIEIKVPAGRWPQLLTGLKPIGTLESENENAEDVGQEFVDVQARVANARRLEERLVALLANRTGKLSDALEVERELARVREEIDRYEGRIRYLRTRAAISTMVVTIHEPGPVLGSQPGQNPIPDAFRSAWRLFVGLIAFLITSLGVIVPLVLIAWLVLVLRRRGYRPK